jgi:hypothetical protein
LERLLAEPQRRSESAALFKDLDQARQHTVKTGQPQTVWVTIAARQYEGLKKELAGVGNIESELPQQAAENDDGSSKQLRIKLTILPPLPRVEAPSSR